MFKKVFDLVIRLALVSAVMFAAYVVSTIVIGDTGMALTPEQEAQAESGLFLISIINALVLSYPILRSRWYGMNLVGAVFVLELGVETILTQVETWYFNSAIQMETSMLAAILLAGIIRAAIFAPLAVWVLGKMRRPAQAEMEEQAVQQKLGRDLFLLAVLYMVVYFMFGYFVAWQFEEIRQYYTGSTAILPFFTHFANLFRTDPGLIVFQLIRGAGWAGLGLLVARMMRGARWEAGLAAGLIFAGFVSLGLVLFPNPYMPPAVARGHFYEIMSSMLLYGGVAGWVLRSRAEMSVGLEPG